MQLQLPNFPWILYLVDVSDIFYFSLLGEGEGGVRGAREGGGNFLLKMPGGGSGFQEGPRGRQGACSESGNLGGGGLNIFFGAETSTKFIDMELQYPHFYELLFHAGAALELCRINFA